MQPNIKGVAVRKRTQIEATNKTMFLWVAGASVLLGFALVGAIFLTQMLLFNEKVLHEKDITLKTLKTNIVNIKELESKVRILDTNQALMDARSTPEEQAIRVVLDALPSEANSPALGSSLQNKLLFGVDGFELDKLQVDPVVGIETLDESGTGTSISAGENTISLSFTGTSGDGRGATPLQLVLENIEKSIRTIHVSTLIVEDQTQDGGEQRLMLTVGANAFYEPAVQVKLEDKTVK